MNITLNPYYVLKNDDGCALLLGKRALADEQDFFDTNINSFIHPFHAQILSFVNGGEYEYVISEISESLGIDTCKVKKFIDALIENKHTIGPIYNGIPLGFPRRTIIKSDYCRQPAYSTSDFEYDHIDVMMKRHKTPTNLTLMVNNICATDCVYCYADKRKPTNLKLPLTRINELLVEARSLGVMDFGINGGELFTYKEWRELLRMFYDNGYQPYISTKYPLKEDDVDFLASLGMPYIQISLDSMCEEHLVNILRVRPNYVQEIRNAFSLLEKYNIPVIVHSILTKYGDEEEDIISVHKFLSQFSNIRYWLIEAAGPSIYSKYRFSDFKPDKAKLARVNVIIEDIRKNASYRIFANLSNTFQQATNISYNQKMDNFMGRGLCSGSFSSMYILPNGEVTICEELYWHPEFIIGDVRKQSLLEIWQSEKAKRFYHLRQCDIPKDSACADCEFYHDCRNIRQTCYRDTIKAYGLDKWYYPDANCPKAPTPLFETKL